MATEATPQAQTVTGVETGTVVLVTQTQNIQMRSKQHVARATSVAAETATDATVTETHPPPIYVATHYFGTLPAPAGTLAQAMDVISPADQGKKSQGIYNFLTKNEMIYVTSMGRTHSSWSYSQLWAPPK